MSLITEAKEELPTVKWGESKRLYKKILSKLEPLVLEGVVLEGRDYTLVSEKLAEGMINKDLTVGSYQFNSLISPFKEKTLSYDLAKWLAGFTSVNSETCWMGKPVIPYFEGSPRAPILVTFYDAKSDSGWYNFKAKVAWGPHYDREASLITDISRLPGLFNKLKLKTSSGSTPIPRELVGMSVFAKAKDDGTGHLKLGQLRVNDYITSYNKNLLKERSKPCPKRYKNPCALCKVGRERCFRSTHPYSIEE